MDLLAPTFDVVTGRAAYDVAEVDEAVAETRRLLAGHPASPGSSRGGFSLAPTRGYDARQVDAWSEDVRRELTARADQRWDADSHDGHHDDPPELRGVPLDSPAPTASSFPAWVRVTALVLAVAVVLFYVASYFV